MSKDFSVVAFSNRTPLNSAGGAVPIIVAGQPSWIVGPNRVRDMSRGEPENVSLKQQFYDGIKVGLFDVSDSLTFGHYLSVANCFFHPILHEQADIFKSYIDSLGPDPIAALDQHFADYDEFNRHATVAMKRAVAEAAKAEPDKEPVMWVHDYQFTTIADKDIFSHHQAWPSTKFVLEQSVGGVPLIELPHFKHLVKGMLDCKLMTMQRNQDVDNFLEVAAMIDPSIRVIDMNPASAQQRGGRQIKVISDNGRKETVVAQKFVGISPETVLAKAVDAEKDPQKAADVQGILDVFPGKNVFLSVHRDCTTKAIDVKLDAIDQLLTDHPEIKESTGFMFFLQPTRGEVPAYAEYQARNRARADEINAKHGPVIHYVQDGIPNPVFMALLRQPNITGLFNTATRDGHDLTGREAVAANDYGRSLALIVSAGIGAVDVLGGTRDVPAAFVLKDPRSASETASLIQQIVKMSKTPEGRDEIAQRFNRMKRVSSAYTAEAFGTSVLDTYRDISQDGERNIPSLQRRVTVAGTGTRDILPHAVWAPE